MKTDVHIIGRGHVGRSLFRALQDVGWEARLEPGRRAGEEAISAGVVLLAVRDDAIAPVATAVARRLTAPESQVVAHLAGALGRSPLEVIERVGAVTARAHPVGSFVDGETSLARMPVTLTGATPALRAMFAALEMTLIDAPTIDATLYHAALALAANGLGAIVAEAKRLLSDAGLDDPPEAILVPLLRSVVDNVARLGADRALSGPVRRGAVETIRAHRARLDPSTLALYDALVRAQVDLAAHLGDASPEALAAIESMLPPT